MNVLMITGDANMLREGTDAHARLLLQQAQVENLRVVFWGRGSLFALFKIRNHFDVVTVQDPFWRGLVGWVVAHHLGAKINVQVHTDLEAQNLFRRTLAEFVLRRAGSIRVVSEKIKAQVQKMNAKALIHVLPIFVDLERFRSLVQRPHDQKTILWIGRFEEEKDPRYALSVLETVRGANVDAKLVLLGKGSLETSLRARAKDLPVEFPGWQDPTLYLVQADVVLCTSRHESWGASIIEALAAGVAVIAPDVGIAKEAGAVIVSHEELGAAIIEALRSQIHGVLKLPLLSRYEWAKQWKESLQ
jgi:glycosyltransferase involved in cell wall biosynthesis